MRITIARLAAGLLLLAAVAGGLSWTFRTPAAVAQRINTTSDKVAIKGYDPVAYFTEGRAAKGSERFEFVWEGARWRFASAAHRDLFASDPERYAPQYGGFCAMGLAEDGKLYDIDPEAWAIVDGRLVLSWSTTGRERLVENASVLAKSDARWAALPRASGP